MLYLFACLALVVNAAGPGTYAHYTLPNQPSGAKSMEMDHTWLILPTSSEVHGNAVFASTQQWFLAGPGGYMGTQAYRGGDGKMVYKAIFSCWDASDSVLTMGIGLNCSRFGGEGTGSHCIIDFDLEENVAFSVKVEYVGFNASGAFWEGSVFNSKTQQTSIIGQLFHPNYKGMIGYGQMQVAAASFQEYFMADGCPNQALSGISLHGPLLTTKDGSKIEASQATGDYAAGCDFSEVNAMTGKGSVYLLAGGTTKRVTPAGSPLW